MMRSWCVPLAAAIILSALTGCGPGSPPTTGVATNPPPGGTHGTGSGQAADASGIRTVLAPLGINVHDSPSTVGNRIGMAAQDAVLTVLDKTTDTSHGQWYKVQGASVVGWISADPSLSSPHRFLLFPADPNAFSALYLDTWAFAEAGNVVSFSPQSAGTETIVVTTAANDAALGAAGRPGYRVTTFDTVEVCGVTTTLRRFDRLGPAPATIPTPGAAATPAPNGVDMAAALAHLSEIRIPVDATHTLAVDFVYDNDVQVADFMDFTNSLAFPSPLCRGAPPAPSPGAVPAAPPT